METLNPAGTVLPTDVRHTDRRKVTAAGAQFISLLFHPFFLPVAGVAMLLFGNNLLSILPIHFKYYVLAVVGATTLVFPVTCIWLLRLLGVISDLSLTSRGDRVIPLLVVALGYLICAYLLYDFMILQVLHKVLYGALASLAVCFTVNFYWKISLHLTAMGAIVGMLYCINLYGYGRMFHTMLAFIFLAGLLAAARLYLGRHTPAQVLAGFLLGAGLMVFAVYLL